MKDIQTDRNRHEEHGLCLFWIDYAHHPFLFCCKRFIINRISLLIYLIVSTQYFDYSVTMANPIHTLDDGTDPQWLRVHKWSHKIPITIYTPKHISNFRRPRKVELNEQPYGPLWRFLLFFRVQRHLASRVKTLVNNGFSSARTWSLGGVRIGEESVSFVDLKLGTCGLTHTRS